MNMNAQILSEDQVVGLFDNYGDAEHAIRDLQKAGAPADRIGIGTGENEIDAHPVEGARHEGFWRKIADFFEGKDHSADVSEDNSQSEMRSAHVLVRVSALTPEQRNEYQDILQAHGANLDPNIDQDADSQTEDVQGAQRFQLLSEVLRVQKERVSKGEVRFRKDVVTENQTVEVPVTREELVIERMPANAGTPASQAIGSNQEIRVPLSEEKVRVEKKPVVKEEVRVGKKKVQESRQMNEQVKREELRVDREDEASVEQRSNKKTVA